MSTMANVVAYNVFVHATNLKNSTKVTQALQYLLQTPIDISTFQKFEIRKMAEKYARTGTKEFCLMAQKLIHTIDRLERSQSIDNVLSELNELELHGGEGAAAVVSDDEEDEEILKAMSSSSDVEADVEDNGEHEERPANKMYTEQCEDSPRHQTERISLWEKILKSNGTEQQRTPSPMGSMSSVKSKYSETPRFCPIKRYAKLQRGPLRDRNRKVDQ